MYEAETCEFMSGSSLLDRLICRGVSWVSRESCLVQLIDDKNNSLSLPSSRYLNDMK